MKKKVKSTLTEREKQFCYNYVNTGNVQSAALKAGYKVNPEIVGTRLLCRQDVNDALDNIYKQKKKNLIYKAFNGYEKLAFGDISDAIKLVYSNDLSIKEISKMDLFNISEIKKPKDGSMEIKFFDRIKALEKLQQLNLNEEKSEMSLYAALDRGAKAILKNQQEDNV